MQGYFSILLSQIKIVLEGIPEYFKESPVSMIFLSCIIIVFILNIFKRKLVLREKKRGTPHQSCDYLVTVRNEQDCNNTFYRKYFRENGNSCEKCRGKFLKMSDDEAENRVASGKFWKHAIVWLANFGKNILPYITFFYTLIIAILENNK